MVKVIYQQCLTCQLQNPRKTIFVLRGLRSPPSGPFEHLRLDFIQLPLNMGFQCILVIVCMFSTLVEVCPCLKADALVVAR